MKTNRQKRRGGGVQKNQHTEWIGKNWFEKKQEKQDTKSRHQNPGHVRREEGANTADWREESGDARREESEGRKERRQQSERRERERESRRYGVCRDARDKRGRPLVLPVFLLPLPVPTLSHPPLPRAIQRACGKGNSRVGSRPRWVLRVPDIRRTSGDAGLIDSTRGG